MILVTIGTFEAPFDRLLMAVAPLADEDLVIQSGTSRVQPHGARCVPYVTFDELRSLMVDARVVVTHAGVGSVLLALSSGKRPVVVPRRARFDEAVDDHQLYFGRRLSREGLVSLVEDASDLVDVVRRAGDTRATPLGDAGSLARDLGQHLRTVVCAAD